jgi:hypothetical protein
MRSSLARRGAYGACGARPGRVHCGGGGGGGGGGGSPARTAAPASRFGPLLTRALGAQNQGGGRPLEEQVTWDMVMVFKVGDANKMIKVRSKDGQVQSVSEVDYFRDTTAEAVHRLQQAGLHTDLYYSVQRDEIYCRIGASEKRLQREADRIDYDLQLDTAKVSECAKAFHIRLAEFAAEKQAGFSERVFYNLYGKFGQYDPENAYRQDLYVRYNTDDQNHKRYNSFFSTIDRIKLTVTIIEADSKLGGAEMSPSKMIANEKQSLIAFFPLHEPHLQKELAMKWNTWFATFKAPLKDIRNYFGEQVAFYFAWLAFYNRALVMPAILGLLVFIWQIIDGRVDVEGAPFFALLVSIGATVMLEMWKRHESKYRIRWGMSNFASKEQPRPEFKGEFLPSPVDGRLVEQFPWTKKILRALFSQTVIMSLIGVVIASVVGVFLLRKVMAKWSSTWGSILTAIINAVQIQILNVIYGKVSLKLNEYENHRTDSEYENALIAKTFLFKFVNSYNTLFYIAFIKKYDDTTGNDTTGCLNDDCLGELRQQLGTIFISLIVINNIIEVLIPYIKTRLAERANRAEEEPSQLEANVGPSSQQRKFKEPTAPEKEFELEPYNSTFDDFDELVIQFGYVSMFVVAFPIAPLLALINNVFETKIDSGKLMYLTRRPEPRGAANIGTWYDILNIVSYFAVLTNVGIVAFTSDLIREWLNQDRLPNGEFPKYIESGQLWVFLGAEHIILLIKFAVAYFVPDVPYDHEVHLARQDYIVNVLLNGMEEEEDDDVGGRGKDDDEAQAVEKFDLPPVADTLVKNQYDW